MGVTPVGKEPEIGLNSEEAVQEESKPNNASSEV